MDLVHALFHLGGDLAEFGTAAVVYPRRVGQQVGNAVEPLGHTDGDLQRGHSGPERRLQLTQHRFEVGVLAVQLVHEHQTGQPPVGGLSPEVHRGVVQPAGRVDHEHGEVSSCHGPHRLTGEVKGARCVQQVDLVVVPFEGGQGSGQRMADLLLLRLVVAHRRPVLDPSHTGHRSGPVEHRLGQGRLPRSGRPHEDHVADAIRLEGLHGTPPPPAGRSPSPPAPSDVGRNRSPAQRPWLVAGPVTGLLKPEPLRPGPIAQS